VFCFRETLGAVIPQQQLAMLFRKPFDAALEAVIFQLEPIWIVCWRRSGLRQFPPQVFEVNFVGDAEEVARAVAAEFFFDFFELAGNAVDGLVGKVFGFDAPSPGENLDEAAPDLLVLEGGLFAMGIKPIKQGIKSFL
jgi:hypothetical protein